MNYSCCPAESSIDLPTKKIPSTVSGFYEVVQEGLFFFEMETQHQCQNEKQSTAWVQNHGDVMAAISSTRSPVPKHTSR